MEKRIRPLKSIKTKEEYEEYKKCLDRYLLEYKWYESHGKEDAKRSILEKASRCEENSDSKYALENRARLIENDEYIPALERNIVAYQVTIAKYDAIQEGIPPVEVLKGILTGDEKIKNYLKRRDLKDKLETNGFPIIEPIDLGLQSTEDAIRQVFEECDFINIQKPEYSLVPVCEKANEIQTEVMQVLKDCLNENNISMLNSEKVETNLRNTNSKIEALEKNHRDYTKKHSEKSEGYDER